MSGNDQVKSIYNTATVAASFLKGATNVSDAVLGPNAPYKRLLGEALLNGKGKNGRRSILGHIRARRLPFRKGSSGLSGNSSFQDIYAAQDGKEYFENGMADERKSFMVLSYINDDLLNDIDPESCGGNTPRDEDTSNIKRLTYGDQVMEEYREPEPSLFEGFQATIAGGYDHSTEHRTSPDANSSVKLLQEGESHNLDLGFPVNMQLPDDMSPEDITNATSQDFLEKLYRKINQKMNLLEINKKLASSEIKELDEKIRQLKFRRDLMFNRIASLEENEIFLENNMNLIRDRVSSLREAEIEGEDVNDSRSPFKRRGSVIVSRDVSHISPAELEANDLRLSRRPSFTLDTSVRDDVHRTNGAFSNPLQKFFQPRNKKYRKTYPTLQQYYTRGSEISAIEKAHKYSISALDFDIPFGTLCTAGLRDHSIKIWDLSQNKQVGEMSDHSGPITCLEMGYEYNMLATGSKDSTLKLWDLGVAVRVYQEKLASLWERSDDLGATDSRNIPDLSGVVSSLTIDTPFSDDTTLVTPLIHSFESHLDEVTSLSINSSHLISASQDRTVRNWDLHTGNCVQIIDLNLPSIINSTDVNIREFPDMNIPTTGALQSYDVALATGTRDGVIRLWDLRSGEVVRAFDGHALPVTCLKFDSRNIISGSLDKSIKIWDLRMGSLFEAFVFESPVLDLDFDEKKIVVATNEESVKVFDREEGRHWSYGSGIAGGSLVRVVSYKNGYLVNGRSSGDIQIVAV